MVLNADLLSKSRFNKLEEVEKMRNPVIEYFEVRGEKHGEKRGEERCREEIAKRMLASNFDVHDIIKYTGIDEQSLNKLRSHAR